MWILLTNFCLRSLLFLVMPIMSPSDKFSLLVSFLFAKMAAGDPLPAQMEVTISSHPSWIIKPPTALKDGAEALPSQQSNLEDFLQKEHVQHWEACRQAILNIPLIMPSPHNSDNESDLEPHCTQASKKCTYITETSEEEDKEDFIGCKDAQMNPNPKSM